MTINERVSALHILERFVRMSRMLLPSYFQLMEKQEHSPKDERKIDRIKSVYESFKASPSASEYLLNSNVIELIQRFYGAIKTLGPKNEACKEALEEFISESDRLIANWNYQLKN